MSTKLVIFSAFLSPYRSGAEAMVEEVAVRLPGTFDVLIITGRYQKKLCQHEILKNKVRVVRVGIGLPIDKWLYPFLAPIAAKRYRPDIIHAVLESFAGLALVLAKFFVPNAQRILTLQSTNTSLFLKSIHRSAHTITAISKVLQERAKKFGRNDVIVIPNGIDIVALKEARNFHTKDSGRVLFVGRLEPMKGVDMLLRAFAKAVKGLPPDVHLRIVGSGGEEKKLKALAATLEIDHRTVFVGRVTGKALADEYAKAEIFCGLSRSEALGNVFLEAQAAGCAVLATRVGGIVEIVEHGRTGILVPSENVEEAASALRELLSDTSLRAKLSIEAQKNAEKYGWDGIAKRYDHVLQAMK